MRMFADGDARQITTKNDRQISSSVLFTLVFRFLFKINFSIRAIPGK